MKVKQEIKQISCQLRTEQRASNIFSAIWFLFLNLSHQVIVLLCIQVCLESADCMCSFPVPPVVEVLEPPFNSPLQERVANQRIAFPCPAKGALRSRLAFQC